MFARFDTGGNQAVASGAAEGAYRYVSRELSPPPMGARRLTIRLRMEAGTTGVAYVDDILVEPLE